MDDVNKLRHLHRRLADERRNALLAAAEIEAIPPSRLLARISDLDGAVAALEAVLEEGFRDAPAGRVSERQCAFNGSAGEPDGPMCTPTGTINL
ncbi:hypothetical protein [Lichenifustis flavocetrariae]|uniref:Uncharacterized protein n=1 Tax=Lichenifustis flavocetrariae TaxID=2949735 RepID=A0AA41Z551_9HYPH|nr:hypothetical protein [Lichenifustis flavocetrariae]MCW6513237.1 hypothetical protein [Lichenifustis flavocetrariae]